MAREKQMVFTTPVLPRSLAWHGVAEEEEEGLCLCVTPTMSLRDAQGVATYMPWVGRLLFARGGGGGG